MATESPVSNRNCAGSWLMLSKVENFYKRWVIQKSFIWIYCTFFCCYANTSHAHMLWAFNVCQIAYKIGTEATTDRNRHMWHFTTIRVLGTFNSFYEQRERKKKQNRISEWNLFRIDVHIWLVLGESERGMQLFHNWILASDWHLILLARRLLTFNLRHNFMREFWMEFCYLNIYVHINRYIWIYKRAT